MRKSHALVLTLAGLAGAALCGCKPTPAPTADAAAQLDTGWSPWLETSAAVAKDPAKGWQLFVFGYANGLQASIADFKDAASAVTPTSNAGLPPAPAADTGHWANDQVNVQLAGGDVLLMWNGFARMADAALQASAAWWNAWPTFDGHAPGAYETAPPSNPARNGLRPAELIWRYSAAAGSWASAGAIDSAYAGGIDVNSVASPDYCAQGVPWVAGYDRPELYADPWGASADNSKQRLYASTACTVGATDSANATVFTDSYEQIYVSGDSGASWSASSYRLNMGTTAFTATSTGRVFMTQWGSAAGAAAPVVYWSDDFGQTLSAETPYPSPVDATYRLPAKDGAPAQAYPLAALPCSTTGLGPPYVYPPMIATVGPGAVLVAYPTTETVAAGGTTVTRQILAVTMVVAPKGGMGAFVVPVALIRPKAQDGSVVMSGLITDQRATANPASLLYWMETTSQPAAADACVKPVGAIARYAMFAGPSQFPGPAQDLSAEFQRSAPNGWAFGPNWSFGDYMKGTSYLDTAAKTLNFVPVWPQEIAGGKVVPFARLVRISTPVWTAPSATGTNPGGSPVAIQPGEWGKAPKGAPPSKPQGLMECEQCRRKPTRMIRGRSTVALRPAGPQVVRQVPVTGKP